MRKSIKLFAMGIAALLLAGTVSNAKASGKLKYDSKSTYEVESLGRDGDGYKVVRLHGIGDTEEAAIEDAMMKAVACALFCGFPSGGDGVTGQTPAIITDPNAEAANKKFLTEFFKSDYKKYVVVSTRVPTKASSKVSKKLFKVRIGMDVSYDALKAEMQKQGVIK